MFLTLDFEVKFSSTNRVIKGSHDFDEGMTCITGANEQGKSLRIEMLRYGLFGSKALRAELSEYSFVQAKVKFKVGETVYTVDRKGNKVLLMKGDEELATGSKPVNARIVKILGYDLEVFDTANTVLQGQIEALSSRAPSERRKMVDRTIGLTALDEVNKEISDKLTSARAVLNTLRDKVIEKIEEPVRPAELNGLDAETLEKELEACQAKIIRKSQIQARLDALKSDRPEPPKPLPFTASLEDVETELERIAIQIHKADEIESYLGLLQRAEQNLKHCPSNFSNYLASNCDQLWQEYEQYESQRVAEPSFTKDELELLESGYEVLAKYREEDLTSVTCPNCETQFTWGENKEFNEKLIENYGIKKYRDFTTLVSKLGIKDRRELRAMQKHMEDWEKFSTLPVKCKPNFPDLRKDSKTWQKEIEERDRAIKALDGATSSDLKTLESAQIELRHKKNEIIFYNKKEAEFKANLAKYSTYLSEIDSVADELKSLKYVEHEQVTLQEKLVQVRTFDRAYEIYEARQAAQASAVQAMTDLEKEIDILTKVRKGFNELKPRVKVHLMPSLNKVSSNLISQMTKGQRNAIEVDEDFNIKVDGQPIHTLSGSAKAVANLALRIGLATVLTNKVFSVLLADEIDAAMDQSRAKYTAECLRNLIPQISQVILVSHKKLDTDHYIEL